MAGMDEELPLTDLFLAIEDKSNINDRELPTSTEPPLCYWIYRKHCDITYVALKVQHKLCVSHSHSLSHLHHIASWSPNQNVFLLPHSKLCLYMIIQWPYRTSRLTGIRLSDSTSNNCTSLLLCLLQSVCTASTFYLTINVWMTCSGNYW